MKFPAISFSGVKNIYFLKIEDDLRIKHVLNKSRGQLKEHRWQNPTTFIQVRCLLNTLYSKQYKQPGYANVAAFMQSIHLHTADMIQG